MDSEGVPRVRHRRRRKSMQRQVDRPRLAPLRNAKDYDDLLKRLESVPTQIEQVIGLMKRAMAAGWMPPAVPMGKVLPQIEQQCVSDVTQSPLFKPFEDFPEAITATPTRLPSRPSPGTRWRLYSCMRPCPGITFRSRERKSSAACPNSAATPCTTRTSKAGRSMPKAWAKTWASTKTHTRSSAAATTWLHRVEGNAACPPCAFDFDIKRVRRKRIRISVTAPRQFLLTLQPSARDFTTFCKRRWSRLLPVTHLTGKPYAMMKKKRFAGVLVSKKSRGS